MYLLDLFGELFQPTTVIALAGFNIIYFSYYFLYVVKKPKVAVGGKAFRQFLEKYCPIFNETYWPTFWCFEGRTQTVIRFLIQRYPPIQSNCYLVDAPDGGEIRLDWCENNEKSDYPAETRPTVMLLPGLTGSVKENYILLIVRDLVNIGYRCVVFNNRGTGDSDLKTGRTYCASNTEDTELVIKFIKTRCPDAPLLGIGVSLGGMILFNYLAKHGEEAELEACMTISPVWDVFASADSMETILNHYLFNRTLAKSLVAMVKRNIRHFTHLDIDHILQSQSIKDFDERFTSKIFGYETADHYFKEASLYTKCHAIAKPTLCLIAGDDPFAPAHSVPMSDAVENDNLAIVMPSYGGHIAFLEGFLPTNTSYMYRWCEQFSRAVFEHGSTLHMTESTLPSES